VRSPSSRRAEPRKRFIGRGKTGIGTVGLAVILGTFLTASCSPADSGSTPEASPPGSLTSAEGQVTDAAPVPTVTVEVFPTEAAAAVFLAAVCPTETALHEVENVAVKAGGWSEVSESKLSAAANSAVESVRVTAETLTAETRWDPEVARDLERTVDEFLALAAPLQQLADSATGKDRKTAWARVEKSPRVAEQRLRLALGLGLARSENDGCPAAPKVSRPTPTPAPAPQPAPQAPEPATGPLPILTGPMVESTSDGICYLDPYAMPELVGPNSDPGATRLIQIFAVMNGINPGPIDGQYGPKTVAAVMQLQRLVGVLADGQVGPITWGALKRYHCPYS